MARLATIERHLNNLQKVMISQDCVHRTHQLAAIEANIAQQLDKSGTVTYVIPAFPFKSPNPKRVINTAKADQAEYVGLRTLSSLVTDESRIIVATDGDVFQDLLRVRGTSEEICVSKEAVRHFSLGLSEMLEDLNVDASGLKERVSFISLGQMLGIPECAVAEMLTNEQDRRIGLGIKLDRHQKFVYKGVCATVQGCFNEVLCQMCEAENQQMTHNLAIGVVIRSQIHSEIIENKYPGSLRLSVHTQLGTSKIGISLIPGCKQAPWNGTLLEMADGKMVIGPRAYLPEGVELVGTDISENRSSYYYREIRG